MIRSLSLAFLGALIALPAAAQQANVVSVCGAMAPFGTLTAGATAFPTVDVNGNLCLSGGGGGGGSTTITAGTTPTSGFVAGQLLMSDGTLVQTAGSLSVFGGYILQLPADGQIGFSATAHPANPPGYPDTGLVRNGSHILGQLAPNSNSANVFRVYNTYTDATIGEWGTMDWQTTPNVLTIGTQANGTGTARNVQIAAGGFVPVTFSNSGMTMPTGGYSLLIGATSYMQAPLIQSWGSIPTITGTGGTCATSTKVGSGGLAGTVVLSGVCASTNTIVFTGMVTVAAGTGYVCDAEDRTTRTAGPFIESATTTSGFTLTVGATSSVAGDVLQWKCLGY